MDLFICTNTFIPLRAAPSHRSEMVSQLLFGERFRIIESTGHWLRAETVFDRCTGWLDNNHNGYARFEESGLGIITSYELMCTRPDGSRILLSPGSELFNLSEDFSSFTSGDEQYLLPGANADVFASSSSVVETALQYLNAPYLWGGRTIWGTDCSGLVQTVFKIHGIALPRDASGQAKKGDAVSFFSDAKPGDVVFFSGENGEINHTGLMISEDRIIHASGIVRVDRIDHQGIWNSEAGRYTHRLRLVKRLIS